MQYAQKDKQILSITGLSQQALRLISLSRWKSTSASYLDVFDRLHGCSRA